MRRLLVWLSLAIVSADASAQQAGSSNLDSLQPGDVLKIDIWREKDLSGEFTISESGEVTLPLLGTQRAVGIPVDQLREQLTAKFREQLKNPSITITPLRRIYVLGEVNEPGLYTVDPTVSLAGAIALAGGVNASGDIERLQVIRGGAVVHRRISGRASLESVQIRSGDQIFVERRGWFERNNTFIISTLLSVTSIVITLLR